ncbi:MAG: DNA-directed RNA polymerase subunit beta', partial [bacterium]
TRRERMGHIELAAPVSHIWYVKRIPSPMALLLDISNQELEEVLYFDKWLVLEVEKDVPLKKCSVLSDGEYNAFTERYPEGFRAGMGAEAVREVLTSLDLKKLALNLRRSLDEEKSAPKRRKIIKRLSIIENFIGSKNRPEWMLLDVIPVIPPDLRPMVQLDGGRFATSDLNDLYRRVINRNNRLERLIDLRAPDVIIRNEKRMLQEAVDALLDNGRRGKPVVTASNRPLKSLSDILKGKQGRFRQNLLGKRVDYSGRSVIVVDPNLKLYQCGLPKRMAIELFKPFIMRRLVVQGYAHNVKSAKRLIEKEVNEVWDALEEITKNHPVLLNRAPTLHRASIQAFEPILVDGEAIKIHPMVCAAFNADFDGDQMAVHIPLSLEAQLEARILMLSAYNLLSPSSGKSLIAPTQDIVLGLYYLTKEKKNTKGSERIFKDKDEVISLYEMGEIDLHSLIKVKINGALRETTPGRLIFNEVVPEGLGYINQVLNKGFLAELVANIYTKYGVNKTVLFLDQMKELGYKFATKFGCSISMADIKIPERKKKLLDASFKRQEKIQAAYQKGL